MTENALVYSLPVLGWRVWQLNDDGRLRSTGLGCTIWRPSTNIAYCRLGQHTAPHQNCHCGFNCYHSIESAMANKQLIEEELGGTWVVGAVALRGHLQVHSTGLRAEEAVVLGLVYEADKIKQLEKASSYYQVPVLAAEQLQQQATTVAAPIPDSERPAFEHQQTPRPWYGKVFDKAASNVFVAVALLAAVCLVVAGILALLTVSGAYTKQMTAATGYGIGFVVICQIIVGALGFQMIAAVPKPFKYKIAALFVSGTFISTATVVFMFLAITQPVETETALYDKYHKQYQLAAEPVALKDRAIASEKCYLGKVKIGVETVPVQLCSPDGSDKNVRVVFDPK